MNAADIVGYAYEADVHCVDCAERAFGGPGGPESKSEDPMEEVHPIFAGEDAYEPCGNCDGHGTCILDECPKCGAEHEGTCGKCDGDGTVPRRCGDCGEALIG